MWTIHGPWFMGWIKTSPISNIDTSPDCDLYNTNFLKLGNLALAKAFSVSLSIAILVRTWRVGKATSLARDIGLSRDKCLNFFNFHIPLGKCKHFSEELSFGLEFFMSCICKFQRLHMESGMTSDRKLKYLKKISYSILLGIKQGMHIFLSSTTLTNLLFLLTLSRGLLSPINPPKAI